MAKKSTTTGNYRCSFCGKSQEEVKKLIAGPSVYICDECIELCNEIMVEEWAQEKGEDFQHLLKPKEIYSHLDQYIINQDNPVIALLPEQPGKKTSQELDFAYSEKYLLSDHCDRIGTTQLIHNLRPQHIIFINGCPFFTTSPLFT